MSTNVDGDEPNGMDMDGTNVSGGEMRNVNMTADAGRPHPSGSDTSKANTHSCDVLIAGGSAGGCAAALAASQAGANVCLLVEGDWPGGQLTSQGVSTPDEQTYIETFGGTRRYNQFRQAVRDYYKDTYLLSPQGQAQKYLNVGSCWVSRLSYEPRVGAQILRDMLARSERLRVMYQTCAAACTMRPDAPDHIGLVTAQRANGTLVGIAAKIVLDATDTGDLLALCGREGEDWVVGAEAQSDTGEPDAPPEVRPHWVQPFTFPFALEWSPETSDTNVIEPPFDYEELKAMQDYKILHGAISGLFEGRAPWWQYRRVLACANFADARILHDVAMINTAGNDYYGGNILGPNAGNPDDVAATLARARRVSLGYVYWLQTECVREEGRGKEGKSDSPLPPSFSLPSFPRYGYPEFRLRLDVFDTGDGCAPDPYIRESRRIRSVRPILEQEIVVKDFGGKECRGDSARAAFMPDSVGVGHYALDIHPNGHGEPNHYVATRPFQIPLGALIPTRLQNLLPACKNLGTTHLTNGAYRLHPIEWNIGESAGLLAAHCVQHSVTPRQVCEDAASLGAFQDSLLDEGIALHWYVDVPPGHSAFRAVQRVANTGLLLGNETDLLFRPDEEMNAVEWQRWRRHIGMSLPESFEGTRAEAVIAVSRLMPLPHDDAFCAYSSHRYYMAANLRTARTG